MRQFKKKIPKNTSQIYRTYLKKKKCLQTLKDFNI